MLQQNLAPEKFSLSTNKISENLCRFAIGRFVSSDIDTELVCHREHEGHQEWRAFVNGNDTLRQAQDLTAVRTQRDWQSA